VRGKSSGEENESDNDQTDERANEEAQDEGKTVLFAAEVLDQPYNTFWKSGESGAAHRNKLSEDGLVRRWATNVFSLLDDWRDSNETGVEEHRSTALCQKSNAV
jgi:hypothetical protein